MKISETGLKDCFLLDLQSFGDNRGFFMESYNQERIFNELKIDFKVKQVNFASSSKNVLRGLHYQDKPYAQSKLVGVTNGAVLDLVVDIRKDSPTYLKHCKVVLDRPTLQLLVPKGFAHGYLSLQNDTLFYYLVDEYYSPDHEKGLLFNDPILDLDWELEEDPIVSTKDMLQPTLENIQNNF